MLDAFHVSMHVFQVADMTSDLEKRSAELHQREEDLTAETERIEQRLELLQVRLTRAVTIDCLSLHLDTSGSCRPFPLSVATTFGFEVALVQTFTSAHPARVVTF